MDRVTYGAIQRESDWDTSADTEGYIYVRAFTTLHIPVRGEIVAQMIQSPGLYGIQDDGTTPEYLTQVYEEERATLLAMLAALGAVSEGEGA